MKVTVLYNQVTASPSSVAADIITEEDSVKTAQEIGKNLKESGYESDFLEITENNAAEIITYPTDLFFNQAFGLGNLPQSETQVANILEKTGKPYTGSPAKAIELSNDKIGTKFLFLKNRLPTAKFSVVDPDHPLPKSSLRFPVIVKLTKEHCSLGLHEDSVIFSPDRLQRKIEELFHDYNQEVLIEEFIDGRELNVTVIGNGKETVVLPISEITFGPYFDDKPKIVDFAAKWDEQADAYKQTVGVCPSYLQASQQDVIENLAKKVYLLSGCRDYARVDFRLSSSGNPYLLEFNANPGIGPSDGVLRSARASGLDYDRFLQKIVAFALARHNYRTNVAAVSAFSNNL